jgi:aldehyde dehydrogenase (NAD+)
MTSPGNRWTGLGVAVTAPGLPPLADQLRATFATGLTRPVAWRRRQLGQLVHMLRNDAGLLTDAMAADLGKPEVEAWLTDVAAVRRDIEGVLRHVDGWAAPRSVRVPWTLQPGRAQTVPEPLGAVLVIAPWNYPVRCLVLPLAFALAAGNTVAVKPSELAPATSAALARLLPSYLDEAAVAVVEGGPDVATALLEQRWDHIFFTGSGRVGRLVMAAAARHLTPVTLELGGKNPAIVDGSVNVDVVARRLVWGKFLNAGQTCVAPDYALVDRRAEGPLLGAVVRRLSQFYGDGPAPSPDLARVVNDAHLERLVELLGATRGRLVAGGTWDGPSRYFAPTVVADVSWDDPLMQEEIFGPVLPVLAYDNIDDVLAELRGRDKPLALYVYSGATDLVERVIAETSSGSVCTNHNAVQLGVPGLPFGGVGASGMGTYHGKAGFDTFSHAKSVLRRPEHGEIPIMYPPYGRLKRWLLRKVL